MSLSKLKIASEFLTQKFRKFELDLKIKEIPDKIFIERKIRNKVFEVLRKGTRFRNDKGP